MGAAQFGNFIGTLAVQFFVQYVVFGLGGLKGSNKRKKIALGVSIAVGALVAFSTANVSEVPDVPWLAWIVVSLFMVWRLNRIIAGKKLVAP